MSVEFLVVISLLVIHAMSLVAYMVHTQKLVNKIMSRDYFNYQTGKDLTKNIEKPPANIDDMFETQDFAPLNDIVKLKQF